MCWTCGGAISCTFRRLPHCRCWWCTTPTSTRPPSYCPRWCGRCWATRSTSVHCTTCLWACWQCFVRTRSTSWPALMGSRCANRWSLPARSCCSMCWRSCTVTTARRTSFRCTLCCPTSVLRWRFGDTIGKSHAIVRYLKLIYFSKFYLNYKTNN